jgi:hypothetical protein
VIPVADTVKNVDALGQVTAPSTVQRSGWQTRRPSSSQLCWTPIGAHGPQAGAISPTTPRLRSGPV